jgi:cobalamin transport system substrate-binding protein
MRRWYLLALLPVAAMAALVLVTGRATPPARGIVSLTPNVTEILFALGLGDEVVGVTEYCDFPAEARSIPRVGAIGAPNLEVVLALRPTLVIGANLTSQEPIAILRRRGIPVLDLKMGSFREMFDGVREIGRATGRSDRAEELVAGMQRELDAVAALHAEASGRARPRVFVEVWDDPLMTAGGPSFIDEVIRRAGGVNVAHDLPQAYPTIGPEQVLAWDPDVIVLGHAAQGRETASRLRERIGWSGVAAVKAGRIVDDISPDHLQRPGPRLVEAVKALARHLRAEEGAETP